MGDKASRIPNAAPSEGSGAFAQRGLAGGAEVEDDEDDLPGSRQDTPLHPGLETEVTADRFYDGENISTEWELGSVLPEIPARLGFAQRWIRFSSFNVDDAGNQSKKTREGWRPRDPKTVSRDYVSLSARKGSFGEVIAIQGMVLCEMPKSRANQRKRFMDARRARQAEAVDAEIASTSQLAQPGIGRIRKSAKSRVTTSRRPLQPQPDTDASDEEVA